MKTPKRQYKNSFQRDTYNAMVAQFMQRGPECFYTPPNPASDPRPTHRRTGASHRCAFWQGFDSVDGAPFMRLPHSSIAWAAFQAGKDCRITFGKIPESRKAMSIEAWRKESVAA